MAGQLDTYLTLSGLLFAIGTFGFLARRNAISMLMSIELMLNAVNLTIVAFGAFIPALQGRGAAIALIIIGVAASGTVWPVGPGPAKVATDALAKLLFSDYVLPFEVVSVLLLAAVIGGVFLAKRDPTQPDEAGR